MEQIRYTKSQKWMSSDKWESWHKEMFSMFWKILLVAFVVEMFLLVFFKPTADCSRIYYFFLFVVRPTGLQIGAVLLFQFIFTKLVRTYNRRYVSIYTICLISILVGALVCVHTSIALMPILLMTTMILTPLYKDKWMTILQAVFLAIIYIADCFYFIPHSPYMPVSNRFIEVSFFIGTLIATLLLVERVNISGIMDEERSKRDSLTHLYNHETFYEELKYRRKRYQERGDGFSVMIGDIDDFKKINDTYGHAFGDRVITRIAEIFLQYGGKESFLARYGGEEFAMILPDTDGKKAIEVAENIRKQFEEQIFQTEMGDMHFTISLGVAAYSDGTEKVSDFFEKADSALYQAKSKGKNCVMLYSKQESESIEREL